jgi:FkbM family methyltransferase
MMSQIQRKTIEELMRSKFGKELIGLAATIYALTKYRKICYISYDGAWVHRYLGETIVDSAINFNGGSGLNDAISESWFYRYKPKYGDTIIDVGAGIGTDTFLFSKMVGPLGKVIAIEAHPRTFACLSKMCRYNNLSNVILYNCAITDKKTDVFIDDSSVHISNTIMNQKSGFKVDGISLDELLIKCKVGHIDFLKMNIEGAERLAIRGMKKTLRITDFVCIACHDFLDKREGVESVKTKSIISDFLEKNGFEVILRNQDERDWVRDHVHGRAQKLKKK